MQDVLSRKQECLVDVELLRTALDSQYHFKHILETELFVEEIVTVAVFHLSEAANDDVSGVTANGGLYTGRYRVFGAGNLILDSDLAFQVSEVDDFVILRQNKQLFLAQYSDVLDRLPQLDDLGAGRAFAEVEVDRLEFRKVENNYLVLLSDEDQCLSNKSSSPTIIEPEAVGRFLALVLQLEVLLEDDLSLVSTSSSPSDDLDFAFSGFFEHEHSELFALQVVVHLSSHESLLAHDRSVTFVLWARML